MREVSVHVQTWGEAGDAAEQCWVAVPGDVIRLLLGQFLAGFRVVTSLLQSFLLRLVTDVDKVTNTSQCERCQCMCRLGWKRVRLEHSAGWQYRAMYRDCCSVNSSPAFDLSRAPFIALLLV